MDHVVAALLGDTQLGLPGGDGPQQLGHHSLALYAVQGQRRGQVGAARQHGIHREVARALPPHCARHARPREDNQTKLNQETCGGIPTHDSPFLEDEVVMEGAGAADRHLGELGSVVLGGGVALPGQHAVHAAREVLLRAGRVVAVQRHLPAQQRRSHAELQAPP